MRRHLSLTLSLALAAAGLAGAGIASSAASAAPLARPRATVKITSKCTPAASFCFKSNNLTVVHGTKVTFKNTTFAPHTVTRCDATACSGNTGGTGTDAFGSASTISSGGKYSFVFHAKGTYVYYCMIHGYTLMHGTITVT